MKPPKSLTSGERPHGHLQTSMRPQAAKSISTAARFYSEQQAADHLRDLVAFVAAAGQERRRTTAHSARPTGPVPGSTN